VFLWNNGVVAFYKHTCFLHLKIITMAEIINAGNHRPGRGVRRSKKLSTKVDLTPMVDLGFLLITFFIFTTSMTEPKALQLVLPKGNKASMPIGESEVLTVIPVAGDKVFYYHGELGKAMQKGLFGITGFSSNNGIGDIVRLKQKALDLSPKYKRDDMMLIIKPSAVANYQNVTDAFDEAIINGLKHYTLVDIDKEEIAELKKMNLLE
jgi:biopolymer transport protein ExbD